MNFRGTHEMYFSLLFKVDYNNRGRGQNRGRRGLLGCFLQQAGGEGKDREQVQQEMCSSLRKNHEQGKLQMAKNRDNFINALPVVEICCFCESYKKVVERETIFARNNHAFCRTKRKINKIQQVFKKGIFLPPGIARSALLEFFFRPPVLAPAGARTRDFVTSSVFGARARAKEQGP